MNTDGKALRDRLIDELGIWGECEDFPRRDWSSEAANGDTQLGYWDWVITKHDLQPPGTDQDERTVSEHQVREIVNTAADDILEAADHPETGLTDAINLLVNAALHRLFDNKDATLAEIVAESYSDDVTVNEVVQWMLE